jgi:hypothetical protein
MKLDLSSFVIGALSVAVIGLLFQIREEPPEPSEVGRYLPYRSLGTLNLIDTKTGLIYYRDKRDKSGWDKHPDSTDYNDEIVTWRLDFIEEEKLFEKEKEIRKKYLALYDSAKAFGEPFENMEFDPTPENYRRLDSLWKADDWKEVFKNQPKKEMANTDAEDLFYENLFKNYAIDMRFSDQLLEFLNWEKPRKR